MVARCPTASQVVESLEYPIVAPGLGWAGGRPPGPGRTKRVGDCEK